MSEHKGYAPSMDELRQGYVYGAAPIPAYYSKDHPVARQVYGEQFDRAIAAHDEALEKALREQIEQQMIERAYFHIAWEKGLTIVPAGHGRAKVPPHWVEAATARLTPYLDIIRGEGSE